MLWKYNFVSKVAFKIVLNILQVFFATRIFARYWAYHVTYQLKISSMNLLLANQSGSWSCCEIGLPATNSSRKKANRSCDKNDTLQGFYFVRQRVWRPLLHLASKSKYEYDNWIINCFPAQAKVSSPITKFMITFFFEFLRFFKIFFCFL